MNNGTKEADHRIKQALIDKLIELDLSGLALQYLPDSIGQLTQLQILNLSNNHLQQLPVTLLKLKKLKQLYLHGNIALNIPCKILGATWQEVIQKKAHIANPVRILDYYFRIHAAQRPLNEVKLILVGRGGVGKTSLVKKLLINQYETNENATEGIAISEWQLELRESETIRVNLWDFGGQEIMHATFQFFLTQRSLYLLVLAGDQSGEDADAEYWLKLIECYGTEVDGNTAPVIIVLNKSSVNPFDLNRQELIRKYSFITGFLVTDCNTGIGIEALRAVIEQQIERLPYVRAAFPSSWFAVKDKLAGTLDNFISFAEFRALCKEAGVNEPEAQDVLATHMHNLGFALNYKDDPRLRDTYVLNPRWVMSGVYALLNDPMLLQQNGELRFDDVARILDSVRYPRRMQRFLLNLMQKFELSFAISNYDTHYLIPELLGKQEPKEALNFKLSECLIFEYHYPMMPEGLLSRFIVRTHSMSENRPRWRTGVILEFEGNRALVRADLAEKRVFIAVEGPVESRRRLLAVIRSDFEQIHASIIKLSPKEVVPIPGIPDVSVSYLELLAFEKVGIKDFPKAYNGGILHFDVQHLLNGVDLAGTRKQNERKSDTPKVNIFLSYSHKDEYFRNKLATHLKILERIDIIDQWNDRNIDLSDQWKNAIDENLECADIILLLVSADFIASDYCWEKEIKRAIERHNAGEATVIPIIIRDVNWRHTPFAAFQALPMDAKPVSLWANEDTAWKNISSGIESVVNKITAPILIQKNQNPLFISRIHIQGIRCFKDLDLHFDSEKSINSFILLFGDNGTGKTTLLRCIAIGLSDDIAASGLINVLQGDMLREGYEKGKIIIEMASESNQLYRITTILSRNENGMEIQQETEPKHFSRDRIFICGYGAARRGLGSQDYQSYLIQHSVTTLFNYDTNLQNPELIFRRIEAKGVDTKLLLSKIDAILMLEPGDTIIQSGIKINGSWGNFISIGALGDGFQASLGWIADLLGWSLFYNPESLLTGISGIVLIDELEQHLHPQWQREIIRLLHEQFPKIQFIVTSHSPMCALGTTALPEDLSKIIHLNQTDNHVDATDINIPKSQRADQVLTSNLFGLYSASGFDVSSDIQRFSQLIKNTNKSVADQFELNEITARLDRVLSPYENDIAMRIEKAVDKVLQRELEDMIRSGKLPKAALDYQIKNSLNKVLFPGGKNDKN